MEYKNKYGLLNAHHKEVDVSENTFLVSLEHYILLRKAGMKHQPLRNAMINYLKVIRNDLGYYDNLPHKTLEKDGEIAYTSHDQYTAYAIFSKMEGLVVHEEIFTKMKEGFGTYNNLTGKFDLDRIVHPRDFIFMGMINGSPILRILSPIYWLMACWTFVTDKKVRPTFFNRVLSFLKTGKRPHKRTLQKTDLELIYWCKREVHKEWLAKHCYRFFDWRIAKRFGSWRQVFSVYFEAEHPNNEFSRF